MATIPPRRGEVLTREGEPSLRFITWIESLTDQSNKTANDVSEVSEDSSTRAQLSELNLKVGSGDQLTWDETGFTWDSTKHSFDQTEA